MCKLDAFRHDMLYRSQKITATETTLPDRQRTSNAALLAGFAASS
jgi:hypothetical protein